MAAGKPDDSVCFSLKRKLLREEELKARVASVRGGRGWAGPGRVGRARGGRGGVRPRRRRIASEALLLLGGADAAGGRLHRRWHRGEAGSKGRGGNLSHSVGAWMPMVSWTCTHAGT